MTNSKFELPETDLDLLEQYLDGALDPDATAQLQKRLASESNLSTALTLSRSQRALRQAALQSMEPDATTAERLVWRVRGAMHDQQWQLQIQPQRSWNQWRIASVGSAAAACLVLGFFGGRLGQSGAGAHGASPAGIASNSAPSSLVELKHADQQGPPSQFVAVNHTPQISVPITNEYGQVVAWQNFDNPEQAKNFTEDLHRAHGEAAPSPNAGQTKLVDHEEQVPF